MKEFQSGGGSAYFYTSTGHQREPYNHAIYQSARGLARSFVAANSFS